MARGRQITIEFLGNARDLNSAIDSAERSTGRMGQSLRKMGKVAALGLAAVGAGFAAWGFESVKSLARIERINAQTAQAIESTGGAAGVSAKHVEDLAGKLENLTAAEAETTQEGANLLLTFTNIKNEAGKGNKIFDQTTAIMVDMSRALGQDTKSSAIQLGKALNDPIKGVTALQRVGVSFTAQQKDTIKSLVESGDTMGAQKLILRELTKEFGGSGKAFAKTTEGQIELAKHAFGTLGESIFASVLPPLGKLAGAATRGLAWVDTKVPAMKAFTAEMSGRFRPALEALQPAIQQVGRFMTTQVFPAFQAFGSVLQAKVMPAVLTLAGYLSTRLGPVFADIGRVIQTKVWPIVKGLAEFYVTTFVPAAVKVWASIAQKMRPAFEELVRTFRSDVLPTVSKALEKFEQWRPTIQKVLGVVGRFIGKLIVFHFTVLGKVLPPLIRFAGFMVRRVYPVVGSGVITFAKIIQTLIRFGKRVYDAGQAVGRFATKFGSAFTRMKEIVRVGITAIVDGVRALPGKLTDLGGKFRSAGASIIKEFVGGLKNASGIISGIAGNVWTALRSLLNSAISRINSALSFTISLPGPDISVNPPDIPFLAKGARNFRGGLAIVGEQGPELVRLPRGSDVIPNSRAGSGVVGVAGVGGGITVNVYGALDPVAVARQIEKLLLQFQRSQRRPLAFKATPA